MATQNLTDYTLILNVKRIFKELLKDKLPKEVKLLDFLPTTKSQLPCLIISGIDCKLQPVGVGRIIGTKLKDKVELGIVEGARLSGSYKFDIWVEKGKNSLEKLDQIAKGIMETIGGDGLGLRKKGILELSIEKISDVESSKENSAWQLKEIALKKTIEYKLLYEELAETKPTEGAIEKVEVNIGDGFKEKMVIEKK